MTSHPPSLASEIDAALAFWRAAGVDCDYTDDARAWLLDPAQIAALSGPASDAARAREPASAEQRERSSPPREHGPRPSAVRDFWGDSPPTSLEAFRDWWLTSPDLGAGSFARIAPSGPAGAPLMVLVPDPESRDESELLSGPQGRLLTRILAAMGLSRSECYLASALPRHTPMADLAGLAAGGMARVTTHHIALAAPRQVLVFGQGLSAFLVPENRPLREINQDRLSPPFMITETLGSMLDMPQLKAKFWRRWMEWSA